MFTAIKRPFRISLPLNQVLPWLVCFSAALFWFFEFVQMSFFNSISADLMREFNCDATRLGSISAVFFYGNVLFLIPAGIILDRYSIRKVVLTAMLISVAATFAFAYTHSYQVAALLRFLIGSSNAFCFLSCIILATRWFPPRRIALVIGLVVTIGISGGLVAQTPFTHLALWLGWRHAILVDGGIGMAIMLLIFSCLHDYPANFQAQAASEKLPLWTSMRQAIRNPQNWLAGSYTSLINLPIFLLGQLWGSMYLMQVHHLSQTEASSVAGMLFLGTMLGSPLFGAWSDKMGSRRFPMRFGAIASLAIVLFMMYCPHLSYLALMTLFLSLGVMTSSQVIGYPVIAESNPAMITGTASSIGSVLIMSGGVIFQPLFGKLMDYHWPHTMYNGVPFYAPANFMHGMMIFPCAFFAALVVTLLLKETYGKSLK